ncbi:hypothetical protein GCM10009557_05760 [Virgisporangium ochraceum]|uniref:Uncharacterized protein n=1 Tax=Virgisporangium ochraceum TaxID=65505 RepID=A0A8J3ZQT4_9ACTN|nr:hypothetical protein [Virgisporangium ochraceum]GIJ66233.1 hypothetical protein Voc01_011500 [Virgisporangium ochraceum]
MKCVFIRYDGLRLCEKRMDLPPVRGDYVTDLPDQGTQEWYVERRRHRVELEVIELWVSLTT